MILNCPAKSIQRMIDFQDVELDELGNVSILLSHLLKR